MNFDPNLSDHPLSCWDVCVYVNDRYIKPYSTDDHQSVYINRGGWCIMALAEQQHAATIIRRLSPQHKKV